MWHIITNTENNMKRKIILLMILLFQFILNGQNPKMVKDLRPGIFGSDPYELIVFNGKLFFKAADDVSFHVLWEFDGVNDPVKIISDGFYSFNNAFCIYKNLLFFQKNEELWSYDGFNQPAKAVNIIQGRDPSNFIVYHDTLFFNSTHEYFGCELFIYDGINDAEIFFDIVPGSTYSSPSNYTIYNDVLYFCPISGKEDLWYYKNNGIDKVNGTENISPYNLFVYNNELFFSGCNEIGNEFWKYNSEMNKVEYFDLFPGSFLHYDPIDDVYYSIPNSSYPLDFCTYNDTLFFTAIDSLTNQRKLWFYTGQGTPQISQHISKDKFDFGNLIVLANCLYFTCNDGIYGEELWCYNGKNIKLVGDIMHGSGGSQPRNLIVYNNKLYFSATTQEYGCELWVYDPNYGVSIPENKIDSNISIYPNPTKGKVTIELASAIEEVCIANMSGKIVLKTKGNNIDLSNLSSGVYIIKVVNKFGEIFERKIVKISQ